MYWRHDFSEFKKRYLQDYLRCKELFDYKKEVLLENQNVNIQIDNINLEDNEEIIESSSSTSKRIYESFNSNKNENSNKCRK